MRPASNEPVYRTAGRAKAASQGLAWQAWLQTPAGRYLCEWEEQAFAQAVVDRFGYYALQVGMPQVDALAANRMPHRFHLQSGEEPCAGYTGLSADVLCRPDELPFEAEAVDLLVLPHQLEFSADPHAVLRECARVLRPEGQILVSGFNPHSLWGLRHAVGQGLFAGHAPRCGEFIGIHRVRDWMKLLSLEPVAVQYGCYAPPLRSERALQRLRLLESAGDRWWPILGSAYLLRAVKRIHAMRLQAPRWRPRPAVAAPVIAVGARRRGAGDAAMNVETSAPAVPHAASAEVAAVAGIAPGPVTTGAARRHGSHPAVVLPLRRRPTGARR